jgi:hypothetical protein
MKKHIVVSAGVFQGRPIRESIPIEEISPNKYKVLASPGYVSGFASGDILELVNSDGHFRVLKRAGNVCVQIFFEGNKESAINEFDARFARLNGWLDGGSDSPEAYSLIYTIPKTVKFSAIESIFDNLPDSIRLDNWLYGNVYGDDGSPLNWWEEETGHIS